MFIFFRTSMLCEFDFFLYKECCCKSDVDMHAVWSRKSWPFWKKEPLMKTLGLTYHSLARIKTADGKNPVFV
jgi:hypothetical protein